jgi:hypothetical protein
MKKNSPAQLGMKISFLAFALFAVIIIIAKLQNQNPSPGGDDALQILMGGDVGRPLNWCPTDVNRLEIAAEPSQTVTEGAQIQSYCQLLSESFDSSKIDMQSFKPLMKAFGANGKEIVLEADASRQVFRYEGLPFGSKQLSRELEKKFKR